MGDICRRVCGVTLSRKLASALSRRSAGDVARSLGVNRIQWCPGAVCIPGTSLAGGGAGRAGAGAGAGERDGDGGGEGDILVVASDGLSGLLICTQPRQVSVFSYNECRKSMSQGVAFVECMAHC